MYNVRVTSLLNMSIYNNCTISELQSFITPPLILPILRAVKFHVCAHTHKYYYYSSNVGFSQIQSLIRVCTCTLLSHVSGVGDFQCVTVCDRQCGYREDRGEGTKGRKGEEGEGGGERGRRKKHNYKEGGNDITLYEWQCSCVDVCMYVAAREFRKT